MKKIIRFLVCMVLCAVFTLSLPLGALADEAPQDSGAKLMAITFDDGPGDYTLDLLDALELSDDALERAESTLTAYMGKNKQPRMPANVGAPQPTNEYLLYHKGGGDPMRGAFGLGRKDES